jgi:hypothetical protein
MLEVTCGERYVVCLASRDCGCIFRTPTKRNRAARAAVGALVAALVVVLAVASGLVRPATVGSALPGVVKAGEMLTAIAGTASSVRVGWMALAMLLTLASVGVSSHLASRVEKHR